MRTCNILTILGKGLLYGTAATAATAGLMVSYQNGKNYHPNRIVPDNSTLGTCVEDWSEQSHQALFYLTFCLLVLPPAAVLAFVFDCYQFFKESRSQEAQPLIRSENPEDLPKSDKCSKVSIGLLQAFLGTLIILGILGSAWTYEEVDVASVFERQHSNATAIECFGAWTHRDNVNFGYNVLGFIWTFALLAPITTLRQFCLSEPEVAPSRLALD